jgi:hypothetical protein
VLPVDTGLHQETVRQHVMATADRLEAELGPEQFMYDGGCQREIETSSELGPPITVGLDGGYIRGRDRGLVPHWDENRATHADCTGSPQPAYKY